MRSPVEPRASGSSLAVSRNLRADSSDDRSILEFGIRRLKERFKRSPLSLITGWMIAGCTVSAFSAVPQPRWQVSADEVPLMTVVMGLRDPGAWPTYKWYILAFLAAMALELFLIVALFVEGRRRRDSEQTLKELSRRLINSAEEERKHLARELHDDIGQRLSLLAVSLDMLTNAPPPKGRSILSELEDPLSELKELATDVHNLSHRLHSSKLQHLGLPAALREVCRQMAGQHHIDIDLRADDISSALPEEVSLCLYRVAQEALNNAVKHSRSKRVEVHLDNGRGRVQLQIRDYGIGFDPSTPVDGLGLATMQERLRMVGGSLSIKSIAGRGTELIAEARADRAQAASHAA